MIDAHRSWSWFCPIEVANFFVFQICLIFELWIWYLVSNKTFMIDYFWECAWVRSWPGSEYIIPTEKSLTSSYLMFCSFWGTMSGYNLQPRMGKSALQSKQRLPGGHISPNLVGSHAKPPPVINIQTESRLRSIYQTIPNKKNDEWTRDCLWRGYKENMMNKWSIHHYFKLFHYICSIFLAFWINLCDPQVLKLQVLTKNMR